jgi:photosystem II stability/assembly factor-like uncharacterized protein
MKFVSSLMLLLGIALPLAAQTPVPYNSVEPEETLSLYRDSEDWIRERYRWFLETRVESDGSIPEGARMRAWRQTQQMSVYRPPAALAKQNSSTAASWVNVGPTNIGGRLTGIAIHPTDPDIVYFTAADGGVWKSTNATSLAYTFEPISDNLPTMAMGSIDIDPNNPDIIYVGTGEANGSADSYPGVGVAKSTDGGATWDIVSDNFARNIGAIKVHKTQDTIVFAAARQGLFRSTDAGVTWEKTRGGVAHDLVLHPTVDSLLYAAVQGEGILRSHDHGVTWEVLDMGIGKDSIGRCAVDLCLTQPEIIYAILTGSKDPYRNKTLALMKSTDGGDTWLRTLPAVNPQNFFNTYGWYNCEIGVHPTNPDRVLVGGVGLYLSMNGGESFSPRGGLHVDQHAIEYSPTAPDICYVGNDGGIYISGSGGITFASLNDDLEITQFYELGMSLPKPDMIMGGTQDNGSNRRPLGNTLWDHETGGDGGYCILDYADTLVMYAEYQYGSHLRSTDGGRRWTSINNGLYGKGRWVTPVAQHPTEPEILFTATTKQLYKTTNRGDLWLPFHGNMDSSKSVNYIAISPLNPDIMYIGYTNGTIWKSIDAGSSWEERSEGLPSGRNTNDIIFHPTDVSTVYACFSHYIEESVFKSTDGGETWESISGNLPGIPTNALAINPGIPDELFVGTDFGVYATRDGGENWEILGDGMPKVVVVDLELHPATGTLYAATHGRSIYALTVALSVELMNFSARRDGAQVLLDWRTSFESSNRGFSVERRTDFGDWQEIGFVAGHGHSAAVQMYDFTDSDLPASRVLRYRLKQIDLDGSVEYSQEIPVEMNNATAHGFVLEQNYPNPFNPVTTIRYTLPQTQEVELYVTDALGMRIATLVERTQHAGAHHVFFDAARLPSGAYFYHLVSGDTRITRKMMVLK